MKIYLIMEGEIVRCVTASITIAKGIIEAFPYLNLMVKEFILISDDN